MVAVVADRERHQPAGCRRWRQFEQVTTGDEVRGDVDRERFVATAVSTMFV